MRCLSCLLIGLLGLSHTASTASAAEPLKDFVAQSQSEIIPDDAKLELLYNDGEFTEGPAPAADGSIIFSDIGNRLLRYDPKTGKTTVYLEPSGRANGLMFNAAGDLIMAQGANVGGARAVSRFLPYSPKSDDVRTIASKYEGKTFNSPNDLVVSKSGVIYMTDPRYVGDEPLEIGFEGVFRITPDGEVSLATKELSKPNGIILSPDEKTMYIADNDGRPAGNHHLVAFDVKDDGSLANKRIMWDIGPNRRGIDGMTIDQEGNVYATAGSGDRSGVYVISPAGKPLAIIPTPGAPTNCVFGGHGSKTLYITAEGPEPEDKNQPRKYALYKIDLKKPGYYVYQPK